MFVAESCRSINGEQAMCMSDACCSLVALEHAAATYCMSQSVYLVRPCTSQKVWFVRLQRHDFILPQLVDRGLLEAFG